jgi:hypothetical protein
MFNLSVHKVLYKWMAALLVFAFLLGSAGVQVAWAASLTVTNLNDSGPGSLRQALADAQSGDTITFAPSLAGGTITLTSGKLVVDKDLTIAGPGANQLALSGNQTSTVFALGPGNVLGTVTVTIQGLTIRDGLSDNSGFYCTSGGIDNQGTLTVDHVTFSHNSGYTGGAICNSYQLTVNNSTFSGNSAAYWGGGIYNYHSLTINGNTFRDNSADRGAGITNLGNATVNASLFSNNSATSDGGGISSFVQLTVNNSTFSNNLADTGSNIYSASEFGPTSLLTVSNSTFSGNTFSFGSIFSLLGDVSIKNLLIGNGPAGFNCYIDGGTYNVAGTNFGDDESCPGFTAVTTAELGLDALADNGGPTQTMALLPGSVAIDAATDCIDYDGHPLTTDQRGVARPQGAACDVGAFELEPTSQDTTAPTIILTTPPDGAVYMHGQAVNADYACQDEADGSGLASCVGTVARGNPIETSSVGSKSFTVNAADKAGNPVSVTHNYSVIYNFNGFFQPVDNLPTLNVVNAGKSIAVKFSLGGNQGLAIFAAGFPISQQVACTGGLPVDDIEQTVTSGGSSLSYDPAASIYTYVWKTNSNWKGQCRTLIVKLSDGTEHLANFKFK